MRQWLKRLRSLSALNSYIKDKALSWESSCIKRYYEPRIAHVPDTWDDAYVRRMLHARMRASGVRPLLDRGEPGHIFCVGTDYDQESTGFLQGLAHFGRVSAFRNSRGAYGLNPPAGVSPRTVRESNSRCLVEQVSALHAEQRIDCLIGTMWAQYLSAEALMAVRRMGIPVLNIAMDDRLPVHWRTENNFRTGAIGLVDGVDLTLQTTREYVPRYLAEGGPAIYWPFGSDPEIFFPAENKDRDVVFVANNYGKRGKLVAAIQAAGVRLECFGHGFQNGHIPGDQVPKLLGAAKIVLGSGLVGHSSRITTLKLRDFDGPMSGSLYVTSYNPDLLDHYEIGKEILVYKTVTDCIEMLKHYLSNDAAREQIGAAGRARAVRDHTWERRFARAFKFLYLQT